MSDKNNEVIIESGLSPQKAIELGEIFAQVKGKIEYRIDKAEGARRWRITLIRGEIKDLLKAVEKAKGLKLISPL